MASKGAKIFGAIIVLAIIIGIIAYIWYEWNHTQYYLAHGCDPKAWNQWGQPTIWSCPAGTPVPP
jgi:hypothetical protein